MTKWPLCPALRKKEKAPAKPTNLELGDIRDDKEKLREYRQRVLSISWPIRFVTEYVAQRANRDDEVTVRIWEGQFKCQPRLDNSAVLSCLRLSSTC